VPDTADDPLALIRSLVSTQSANPGPDEPSPDEPSPDEPSADPLENRPDAAAWLRTAGLLPAEAGLTNSEHAALLRMRDAFRDVIAAHAEGRQDAAAAERLTRSLAEGRLVVTVGPAATVRLATAARASYPSLVATIAVAVADAAAAGAWPPAAS
jgi:hypothetical protein